MWYLVNITSQFYIGHHKNYYATWMLLEKLWDLNIAVETRTDLNSGTKPGTARPQSVGSTTLFYPMSIMLQIFIKDSW